MPKNKKLTLNSGIQTYQILTNNDEVCIQSLSSILLAVKTSFWQDSQKENVLKFFSCCKLKSKRDCVTLEKYGQHLLESKK